MSKILKSAIIGFGGMGHHHAAQYAAQSDVKLVAVCDIDPAKLKQADSTINIGSSGSVDLASLHCYECYEKLVAGEPDLDILDICLPTDLHAEYAIRAVRDGFNVLCEKPMALSVEDADAMIAAAKTAGRKLMIAQCLRFNAAYNYIKTAAADHRYGKLLGIKMYRDSGLPDGWFRDVKRSGGALMDLQLHDVDFLQYWLGTPRRVYGAGLYACSGGIDDCQIMLDYPGIDMVTVAGSWTRGGFSTGCVVVFEKGTLELANGQLNFYASLLGKTDHIDLPADDNMYANEIGYFAAGVLGKNPLDRATPESTRESIRIILAEQKAVDSKSAVAL
ncbi:MAG: Gfo/Idh/MocA family oxidoreductase [Victivallaceae bacterium]|nr:Gfo/Idh/MocA family oxidoreductase [Victivallaceae bacterium]